MDSQDSQKITDSSNDELKTDVYDVNNALVKPQQDSMLEKYHATMMDQMSQLKKNLTDAKEIQYVERFLKMHNPHKRGREEMPVRWDIPIIRVLQGVTKERPKEGRVGDLFTSTLQLLPQPLLFTPLYVHESNRMFPPLGSDGIDSCYAPDAKMGTNYGWCEQCIHLPRYKNMTNKTTPCDNGLIFTVLLEDLRLYVIEFYKTSRSAGVKLDRWMTDGVEPWDNWFELRSDKMSYENKEWYVFKTEPTGKETPPYLREAALIMYDMVLAKRKVMLTAHYERIKKETEELTNVEEAAATADGRIIPVEDPTAVL